MPGVRVDVKGASDISKRITNVVNGLVDRMALHKVLGQALLREIDRQFRTEGAHFGRGWQRLKPETVKRRRGGSSRILQDTGRHLKQTFAVDATRASVRVGTATMFAPVHQFGSSKTKGPGSGIPARPMLPAGNALVRLAEERLIPLAEQHVRKILEGR